MPCRFLLLLGSVLALAGNSRAEEFVLFWSTTGISETGLMYSTALTDFQPAYQSPTPVPTDPNGMQVLPAGTYDLFLWGTFPANWQGAQILGMDFGWQGDATHTPNAAYRHKWGGGSAKRWDGSLGIPLDGVMAAITATGITWTAPYHLMEPDGRFLIGAAQISGTPGQQAIIGQNGHIAVLPPQERDPTVVPAVVTFTPEPTNLLLLTTASLLIRRCRRQYAKEVRSCEPN